MADNVTITQGSGTTVATDDVGGVHYQKVKVTVGPDDTATNLEFGEKTKANSLPVTIASNDEVKTALATIAAAVSGGKLNVDDADTQTALASILSALGGTLVFDTTGLATSAGQSAIVGHIDGLEALLTSLDGKDFATQTTLAAILAKIIAAPATEAKQDTLIAKDFATQTTLAAILAKIIAAPATEAKQDTLLSRVGEEYEQVSASTTATLGASGAAGDLLSGVLIIPATTSPGAVQIKDGTNGAITVFAGGADSVSNLVPFFVPIGAKSVQGAWQVITNASVSAIGVGNFT